MSKWIIFCLVLCLLGTGADAQSIYNRKYLVAGQTVNMTYNPAGTPLENAKDVKAIVYLWRDYVWEADEVDMTWRIRAGQVVTGSSRDGIAVPCFPGR